MEEKYSRPGVHIYRCMFCVSPGSDPTVARESLRDGNAFRLLGSTTARWSYTPNRAHNRKSRNILACIVTIVPVNAT